MSQDFTPDELKIRMVQSSTEPDTRTPASRPICPECGCNTMVLFTPPKEDSIKNHVDIASQEYVDWNRAHLYCCNGETNCKNEFGLMNFELSTPLNGRKVKYF